MDLVVNENMSVDQLILALCRKVVDVVEIGVVNAKAYFG